MKQSIYFRIPCLKGEDSLSFVSLDGQSRQSFSISDVQKVLVSVSVGALNSEVVVKFVLDGQRSIETDRIYANNASPLVGSLLSALFNFTKSNSHGFRSFFNCCIEVDDSVFSVQLNNDETVKKFNSELSFSSDYSDVVANKCYFVAVNEDNAVRNDITAFDFHASCCDIAKVVV